jgi:hypothetical protein
MLEILIILIILTLNLLVVFTIKSRVNMIIFIITANLTTIFLYSLKIDNFLVLKELAIATIIYCATISFLIISSAQKDAPTIDKSKLSIAIFTLLALICATGSFYIFTNINSSLILKQEQRIKDKITKSQTIKTVAIDNKFKYLHNKESQNSILLNRFGDFLIIICTVITFLFLGIKHQKE